ncbi:hypothetical protein MAR_012590 [Mya arenaria]|uniref:CCHC-type domain-containing protein n=1 Tax=Mya arenaria TaxID=6604 RepID=A0ABY7G1K6_MYAAR|nr:hypothetical protein MAR_012590 [Mya arenaria]
MRTTRTYCQGVCRQLGHMAKDCTNEVVCNRAVTGHMTFLPAVVALSSTAAATTTSTLLT